MDKYINADAVKLDIRRYLMPNVDDDGTVTVENAERYFLNLLDNAPAEKVEAPAEKVEAPAEKVEAPAEKVEAPAEKVEAPAEKVEKVVHCCNCIHYKANINKENYCDIHSTRWDKFYVREDDYCSYGEMRSGI